jgi:hypothetical protein
MNATPSGLDHLLRNMAPALNPGVYVFASLPLGSPIDPQSVVAYLREPESISGVLAEPDAIRLGLPVLFRSAWLTLTVNSDLADVGFTAAFSMALAQAGISCNVIAGVHHDHIFVPYEQRDAALETLIGLQRTSA